MPFISESYLAYLEQQMASASGMDEDTLPPPANMNEVDPSMLATEGIDPSGFTPYPYAPPPNTVNAGGGMEFVPGDYTKEPGVGGVISDTLFPEDEESMAAAAPPPPGAGGDVFPPGEDTSWTANPPGAYLPPSGYYSPEYLASIGYTPGSGGGSMWPSFGPTGGLMGGAGGGSFFGGTGSPIVPGTYVTGNLGGGGPINFGNLPNSWSLGMGLNMAAAKYKGPMRRHQYKNWLMQQMAKNTAAQAGEADYIAGGGQATRGSGGHTSTA